MSSLYRFDPSQYQSVLMSLFQELEQWSDSSANKLSSLIRSHAKPEGGLFSKNQLIIAYRSLAGKSGLKPFSQKTLSFLRMKPVRTASGVAPVTVLTKPFPCPGRCIFCPSDVRMPKSYLSDEPGAQRAERNWFDPYLQTYQRLESLYTNGHSVDKVELIILGGTWSCYPESYQIWFIKECFRVLNEFGNKDGRQKIIKTYLKKYRQLKKAKLPALSDDPKANKLTLASQSMSGLDKNRSYNQAIETIYQFPEKTVGLDKIQTAGWAELVKEQKTNEKSVSRCVGLVIETRPDQITKKEAIRIRRLGCTKVQIGFQSLNDDVLLKNQRGHDVGQIRKAIKLLRQAGFKLHAHWMANLYGSSVKKDQQDFALMFSDPDFRPDELKIYPCSLIATAQLMQYFNDGRWRPYTKAELLDVLSFCFLATPEYCRITRVIRDIPSTDIVEGNKTTNFRQLVELALEKSGQSSQDIRAREIQGRHFDLEQIKYRQTQYQTSIGREVFMQAVVNIKSKSGAQVEKLLGFLRLSLPKQKSFIEELGKSAIIREVHVYGRVIPIGTKGNAKAQHVGIGKELIQQAIKLARLAGYTKLAVISAVGTRGYYWKLGFVDGELYQYLSLD
ncbi:tRNA uridine(34) 5-carboxymethylaminomethyl modification radical SAM/GNAT enzyme Elp3 [Patescibacteria group bacterium]|nr:tRNA uridine(34) 5-carboxymethylaminomethyl modification radical SAM/GNAT enzyme Elp3 [Patescibacteria group bacterium]